MVFSTRNAKFCNETAGYCDVAFGLVLACLASQ